jgi:hypothetical protein
MDDTHEEGLEALHNQYHAYKKRFFGRDRSPLPYDEWLEHTAVRLADKLGAATDEIDELREQRDRYKHAADANHDCWVEATQQKNALYGLLASLRCYTLAGNFKEVARLMLHWACWN